MNKETYVNKINKKFNGDIVLIEEYVNDKTKLKHYCKKHDHTWLVSPQVLIQCKYGCRKCQKENIGYGLSGRYETENYFKKLKETNPNFDNIEFITKETHSNRDRVKCRCKVCGYEWETDAQHLLLRHSGCPKCAGSVKYTNEYFINKIEEMNLPVIPLEKYNGTDTKVLCKCKDCGNEWRVTPYKLFHGRKCPKCSKIKGSLKITKTHEEFIEEMKAINPTIQIISKYINTKTKVECKCLECGHVWLATPSNLLKYKGCPECTCSNGERRIHKYLKDNGINYIAEHTFDGCKNDRLLRFDFYLPDYNMCIEYDGEQHYRPVDFGCHDFKCVLDIFNKVKLRDNYKTEFCHENGVTLLRIPYWYYEQIERILEKYLKIKRAV